MGGVTRGVSAPAGRTGADTGAPSEVGRPLPVVLRPAPSACVGPGI